ncbi:MAG TPA: hypothetical protein VGG10_11775 [Rhizomicrobium sp.]|jgi:hypothetical protein
MHYYFDTDNDDRTSRDERGQDHADPESMRDAAIRALPDLARDDLPNGDRRVFTVKVRDESGRYVFQATLSLIATWLN